MHSASVPQWDDGALPRPGALHCAHVAQSPTRVPHSLTF